MEQGTPDREEDQQEAQERSAPAARVVHAAVAEQGEEELARPAASLFWSAVAAGVAIMVSLSASGALHHALSDAPWRDAVVALGYPLGFVLVILGRLQLFTEQTVVAVLPFARAPGAGAAARVARLWSIVFLGNMVGAAAVAALAALTPIQSPEMLDGMAAVAGTLTERGATEIFAQAVPAGFLIGSIAWIRSATEGSGFWVVFAVTFAIALCGFTHVVVGAAEAFLLTWRGEVGLGWAVGSCILPALAGNIVGGTGLFALLVHAQVKDEL